MLSILLSVTQLLTGSAGFIVGLVKQLGYLGIFVLMALEGSSLPVPSEVVMPLAGLFAKEGILNFPFALAAGLLGSIIGIAVDYYIGYFVEKDIVYRHLQKLHIKRESLDKFDIWFKRNGVAAVFITRLIPVIRTFISFPAGFAKMDQKRFFAYSIIGSFIWDTILMSFGFYALSVNNAVIDMAAIGTFGIVLYLVYKISINKISSSKN